MSEVTVTVQAPIEAAGNKPQPFHNGVRGRIQKLVESNLFVNFIIVVILLNAVTLGMQTSAGMNDKFGFWLELLDTIALGIFIFELLLKMYVYRLGFVRDGWNVFDFLIVAIALLPASGGLSVLRALRILRVFRLISVIPSMRKVVDGLLRAMPGMGSVVALIAVVFYVGAVLATSLFSAAPAGVDAALYHQNAGQYFASIGESLYTLFQIMTLESWSMSIVRPVISYYSWAWAFFVPFIICTSFAVLNLFIGVMVTAMDDGQEAANERHEMMDELKSMHVEMRTELQSLREELQKRS